MDTETQTLPAERGFTFVEKLFLRKRSYQLLDSKAAALLELGRFDEAETAYRELTDRFPTQPAGFLGMVHLAARQDQHDLVVENPSRYG